VSVLDQHAPLVGLHVVQYWKLAPEFSFSTLYSKKPGQVPDEQWGKLTHTISLASIMADHCGYAIGDGEPASPDPAIYQETLGLSHDDVEELKTELEDYFRPEFINRLDDKIVFRPLSEDDLVHIVDLELKKVAYRVAQRNLKLEVDESAKVFLRKEGYKPEFGARPLRRAIEQFIENPMSESILRGEFNDHQTIFVTKEDDTDELTFTALDSEPEVVDEQEVAGAGAEST